MNYYKRGKCIYCGKPCNKNVCKEHISKNKYKGMISRSKSLGNRK